MSERILTGELDVPIEGAVIKYDPPFEKWCSHHLVVESSIVRPVGRVVARTYNESVQGCSVAVLHFPPPIAVGKDAAGNDMLKELPPESVGGHVSYKIVGE